MKVPKGIPEKKVIQTETQDQKAETLIIAAKTMKVQEAKVIQNQSRIESKEYQ